MLLGALVDLEYKPVAMEWIKVLCTKHVIIIVVCHMIHPSTAYYCLRAKPCAQPHPT